MKKAQYLKYRANGHLLQDPILCNPPAAAATEDCGPFRQMQYSIVHSLRFAWNAYGLRAAQSPITDTAYDTVV